MLQQQAIRAAEDSNAISSDLATSLRKIGIVTNHVTAIGLITDLQVVSTELQEHLIFMSGDKSGDLPSGTVVNPVPQFVRRDIPVLDSSRKQVINDDNQLVYRSVTDLNPKFTQDSPSHIFKSETGLGVELDGTLTGSDQTIQTLLLRLQVASAIEQFRQQPLTPGGNVTVGQAIESVVTI